MYEIYIIYHYDQSFHTFRTVFTHLSIDAQVQEINETLHVKKNGILNGDERLHKDDEY